MAGSVGQPTQTWFPWVGVKSTVGTWLRGANSSVLGLGYYYNTSAAQNDERVVDLYLDSVVWKFAMVAYQDNTRGISTIQLDGVSQGTLDWYNATDIGSKYKEITGIAVATPGVKAYKMIAATKNGSSSGYAINASSDAWISTSGAYSTPSGTDTPGYTWEWIPWMGYKGNTGSLLRWQDSTYLGGGSLYTEFGTQNQQVSTDAWIDAGTFTCVEIGSANTNMAIHSVQLDGSTVATNDYYAAGATNTVKSTTGITVATAGAKSVRILGASKNASSSSYFMEWQSLKFIRTGA